MTHLIHKVLYSISRVKRINQGLKLTEGYICKEDTEYGKLAFECIGTANGNRVDKDHSF